MLGIGPTELIVIAVLFLVIFGPSKMPQIARDIGKFVGQARDAIDEFKDELTAGEKIDSPHPNRNRGEGSRRRKDDRNRPEDYSRKDGNQDSEDDLEEGSPESTERVPAEYDL